MRSFLFIISITLFISPQAWGQSPSSNIRTIQLRDKNCLIEFSILTRMEKEVTPKRNRLYYWYSFDKVQMNEGAFSGFLLHGLYSVFNLEGQLVEQGAFEYGQKNDTWTKWDSEGFVINETEWKNSYKNGQSKYYYQGELIKIEHYKDNILHGNIIKYDVNGNKEIYKYRNGKLVVQEPKEKKENSFFKRAFRKVFKAKDKNENVLEEEENSKEQENW